MGQPSLSYANSQVQIADPYELSLVYSLQTVGGAVTMVPVPSNGATLFTGPTGTSAITEQAQIDDFLGTTGEFNIDTFSVSTTTAGGIIVNMGGQAARVVGARVTVYQSTGLILPTANGDDAFSLPVNKLTIPAPAAAPLVREVSVGAYGNIGLTYVVGNALVTGDYMVVKIMFSPK